MVNKNLACNQLTVERFKSSDRSGLKRAVAHRSLRVVTTRYGAYDAS